MPPAPPVPPPELEALELLLVEDDDEDMEDELVWFGFVVFEEQATNAHRGVEQSKARARVEERIVRLSLGYATCTSSVLCGPGGLEDKTARSVKERPTDRSGVCYEAARGGNDAD